MLVKKPFNMGILSSSSVLEGFLWVNTFAVGITAANLTVIRWQLSHLFTKPEILVSA